MTRYAPDAICEVAECGKPRKDRQWCSAHYNHWRKFGDPLAGRFRPRGAKCSIDDCGKPVFGQGYCEMHHARIKRNGDPLTLRVVRVAGRVCGWFACGGDVFAKDVCRSHYVRMANAKRRGLVFQAHVYDYTFQQVLDRFAYFGNKCWMCGKSDLPLTVDHVKPVSRGGKDCPSNFRPACQPCNSRKSNRWHGIGALDAFITS